MGEYIQTLRQFVGSRPLLQCGATVIVMNGDGLVLMLKRLDNGYWGFPGGATELGEQLEDTARRELLEETGIHAARLQLLNVFSGKELYYKYPNGDEVYNVDAVFFTRYLDGDVTLSSEHTDFSYVPLAQVHSEIMPPQRIIARYLQETGLPENSELDGL